MPLDGGDRSSGGPLLLQEPAHGAAKDLEGAGPARSDGTRRIVIQAVAGIPGATWNMWRGLGLGFLALALLTGCKSTITSARSPVGRSRGPFLFRDMSARAGNHFTLGHAGRTPLTILETLGPGTAFLDTDNDGWLDLFLVGPNKVALYHNNRDGTFTDVTRGSGLRAEGFWQGIATGDYDNDSRVDVFVTGYRCCALYHNEGSGRFRNVAQSAGVDSKRWGSSACFVDVDRDGLLDLFVTNYVQYYPTSPQFCKDTMGLPSTCGPTTYDPEKPRLYHNIGHGHFVDETAQRGFASAHGNALGAAIADYDDDGWVDIAVANDQLPRDLFHNKGHGFFENVGVSAGTAYNVKGEEYAGMGIDWADYNDDGALELIVTTYQHQPKSLFAPVMPGVFTDICYTAGIGNPTMNTVGFGAKFLDYDNDGLPDLAIANGHVVDTIARSDRSTSYRQPTQLFHNVGGGRLVEVTPEAGPDFERPIVGRGLAVGDYDNDGRVDLLVADAEGHPLLLHNEVPSSHHWLSLQLTGTRSNRAGIGAHLTVEVGGRKWRQVVATDGSFQSASDGRVHLGLGPARQVDRVQIRWPSGEQTVLKGMPADQFVRVEEGHPGYFRVPSLQPRAGMP
jgi:enediyne biosynthesis protein E4